MGAEGDMGNTRVVPHTDAQHRHAYEGLSRGRPTAPAGRTDDYRAKTRVESVDVGWNETSSNPALVSQAR
jgi:hypothetical protein